MHELEREDFLLFIDWITHRATMAKWAFTDKISYDGQEYNLFKHYRELSMDSIQAHARSYLLAKGRYAQDSYQMYQCLRASLTTDAIKRLLTKSKEFHVQSDPNTKEVIPDGAAYFKVITKLAKKPRQMQP